MEQITTLEYLISTAGTTAFVLLVTQYVKPLLPKEVSVRVFVLLLCMTIQIVITTIMGTTVEGVVLAIVNSFIAAAATMGAYEATFNKDGNG